MKQILLALIFSVGFAFSAQAGEKLNIVTSSSTFAELVRVIAGDRADIAHIASPKFNPHFIEPRPSDVRKVRKAQLFVFAGLDHEAWVDSLLEAVGKPELFRGGERNLELSGGIRLLEVPTHLDRAEGDIHAFGNPHYPMNPENLKQMAETIKDKLSQIDPANASVYAANTHAFTAKLASKIIEWKSAGAPCLGKEIVSYHKDIEYLAEFLGLHVHEYVEPKPGIPPSPKHLAKIEADMKSHRVKAITMATFYPRDAADALAKRTGARVVIIAQNVREVPQATDLWSFYDYNVRAIAEALK